ncbi:MAG: 2Fe-2S iron-sulfur cluster binding domain-containing protein [Gammaproteobacteria bacterium]|nr:2Fe-2S iron-sulfur cluster binding domain-containing protein [Gammaproteobacteria bacterium]
MRNFVQARIVDRRQETADSVVLTLAVPPDVAADFRYTQGQHLPVRAEIDGRSVRRTYSICASAAEQKLRIAVRIQEGGVFSGYVAKRLAPGDRLEVMPPTGHFHTRLDASQRKTYAAFVAGSGITPMLSIVKTTLETEPQSRFILFYGNRTAATTMFIEELWALKNLHGPRLSLHFIMSREPMEIEICNGRLERDKVTALHEAFLAHQRPDEMFLCGPNPMIDELTGALTALGYDTARIHSERFRPGLRGEAIPGPALRTAPREGSNVTIILDGRRRSFRMTSQEPSILDAARANGIDLPFSCKGGVCATCRSRLVRGEVSMTVNYALESWELEKGYILTCQANPKSGDIELDFDQT